MSVFDLLRRYSLKRIALGGFTGFCVLVAVVAVITYPYPRQRNDPISDLAKCQYDNAQTATQKAESRLNDPWLSKEAAVREQAVHAVRSAKVEEEKAKACEVRQRELSDLRAQWTSGYAAEESVRLSSGLWIWAVFDLALLGATLMAAVIAIVVTERTAAEQIRTIKDEAASAAARFTIEIDEYRKGAEVERALAQKQAMAYVRAIGARYVPFPMVGEGREAIYPEGRIEIVIENFGQTVARNVFVHVAVKIGSIRDGLEYSGMGKSQSLIQLSNIAPKETPEAVFAPKGDIFSDTILPSDSQPTAIICGEIRYSDIFGARYSSFFQFTAYRGLHLHKQLIDLDEVKANIPAFVQTQETQWERERYGS